MPFSDQRMKEYQPIKCNDCHSLYYTPKPAGSKCTECGSVNITMLTDNEATLLFKEAMAKLA